LAPKITLNAPRLVFELIKETGWSYEYVMGMPARRFFAFKKVMFEINREDKYSNLMDLCDVQFITLASAQYHSELKDHYKTLLSPDLAKKRLNSRQFNVDNEDERQKVDAILQSTFKQKARLMGL